VLMHQPESDLLEHVSEVTVATVSQGTKAIALERVARMGHGYRVKFAGFDDRSAAELLRGATLWVPRDTLPALDDAENYLVDLIGASVMDSEGVRFGIVAEVLTYPSVDSLVIVKDDGARVEQPLVEQWVEICRDEGRPTIVLRNLEGLL